MLRFRDRHEKNVFYCCSIKCLIDFWSVNFGTKKKSSPFILVFRVFFSGQSYEFVTETIRERDARRGRLPQEGATVIQRLINSGRLSDGGTPGARVRSRASMGIPLRPRDALLDSRGCCVEPSTLVSLIILGITDGERSRLDRRSLRKVD